MPHVLNCDFKVTSDPGDVISDFDKKIRETLDVHAPLITKTVHVRPNTKWYNANIRRAKVIRRRLERRWIKRKTAEARLAYKKQCDLVNYLMRDAKDQFLSHTTVDCGRDQRKLFDVTKGILGWDSVNTGLPSNHGSLPDIFNDVFVDKIVKIRNDISYEQKVLLIA